jgi:hypothetical protein
MQKSIVEDVLGKKFWYINGKLGREDGPAVEYSFRRGDKFWYINGKRHREDGPAVEISNGTKMWYLDDVRLTEEEFTKKVKKKKFIDVEIETLKSYGIEVV